jgi:hypothetical protein
MSSPDFKRALHRQRQARYPPALRHNGSDEQMFGAK